MTAPVVSDDDRIRNFLRSVEASMNEDLNTKVGNLRGMMYGSDGVGKTIAALALMNYIVPPDKTILLIDTAEGWVSMRNHKFISATNPDGTKRFRRIPYQGESWLKALHLTMQREIKPFNNVGGVVFDEFSNMADSILQKVGQNAALKDKSKDPDDLQWPEYKITFAKCKKIIEDFSTLPGVHVILTAHIRQDKDGRNLIVEAPNFIPSIGGKLRQPMHFISYVSVDDAGNRTFQMKPDRGHICKCQIGGMDRVVDFATLAMNTKKWLNGELETVEEEIVTPLPAQNDPENDTTTEGMNSNE